MTHEPLDPTLDRLVQAVVSSPKYQAVTPELVANLGRIELAKRSSYKEALKATRNKLHQVAGAYLASPPNYARLLERLRAAKAEGEPAFLETCRYAMSFHASTRERLPILSDFYTQTLSNLPPVRSVLDVACGLNPLSRPWMPLPPETAYTAVDIYRDMIEFINLFFQIAELEGRAYPLDVVSTPPAQPVDLALVLKTIPCLEQADKNAGARLLDSLNARYLLVSFPAQSLGGRRKGMPATYEEHFRELAAGRPWQVERFEFPTELAFLVKTQD